MKRLLIILVAVFLATAARSQTFRVVFTMQSSSDASLLPGVAVTTGTGRGITDTLGRFSVALEGNRSYSLKFRKAGYRALSEKIAVSSDSVFYFFMEPDTVMLEEVTVQAAKDNGFGISRLRNIEGTTIFAGKKSEAVYVQDLNANLAANNSRQVFSKIPGINVFENEGSGATVGIGGRGLNPNRIANFNTRQNGYDISADALGYPESYYTPPTEAVERIEILRGAAGLQFGTQFGGMINYRFTEPSEKKLAGNFRQTLGSFGFFNSFNQLSGTSKKLSYNAFYQYKTYQGWRKRSEVNSHNAFASLRYKFSERLAIRAEFTHMQYLAQQPGGLSDKQFNEDPSQVNRSRNWFRVNWNLFSASLDYRINEALKLNFIGFGLSAGRDALGLLLRPERGEDLNSVRNLLSDDYRNFGGELRLLQRYKLFSQQSHFLIGARLYRGETDRRQGNADRSDRPVFEFLNAHNLENSAYYFPSSNISLFAENIFQINKRWSITPGLRFEKINTAAEGYYRLLTTDLRDSIISDRKVQDNRFNSRDFILAGIGTQLKLNQTLELYGNLSQNYRSINFNDMRVANANSQVDPDLRDESGYTADGGLRGTIRDMLYFDAGIFLLQYNDRLGTTLRVDSLTFQIVRYRTNIGASRTIGAEFFGELDWLKLISRKSPHRLSTFVNISWIESRYYSPVRAVNNKTVEFVPRTILRTGITYAYKKFGCTLQYSRTGEQFSDATNAAFSPSAIYGIIPAYSVMDLSANYSWKHWGVIAGVNNLLDEVYFTRRADGYPGPGIIPADPRNYYLTLRFLF